MMKRTMEFYDSFFIHVELHHIHKCSLSYAIRSPITRLSHLSFIYKFGHVTEWKKKKNKTKQNKTKKKKKQTNKQTRQLQKNQENRDSIENEEKKNELPQIEDSEEEIQTKQRRHKGVDTRPPGEWVEVGKVLEKH